MNPPALPSYRSSVSRGEEFCGRTLVRKRSRSCCVNGASTRFLEPTMKAASTGSRLSTITTRRCTTVPGWEKNFPPTCSRNYSALRKMPSCRKPPCSARICSRSAPVTWRVPSSRSSACFLSMPTVLTRKRKPSRECCKRRKRKNAVHAAFETRLFIQLKSTIMQQEDDIRGLAKTMEFMRAVSILFLVIHVYWYCYQAFSDMGISIGIVDKILLNFQRTAGLFRSLLLTKVFALIFLALSCLGTKGVKNRDMTWNKIYAFFLGGLVLFFMNWWMLELPVSSIAKAGLYTATLTTGYILMLMAGVWVSRMLKNDLMDDVFNMENESFMQNTVLMENEYSVNLPTKFVYQKKEWDGWINIVNPFRATIVLGTPGSGKSFAVVNSYIKQQISKGFAVYIYDYKFDDLSIIAYNELLKNLDKYKVKPEFYVINFDDPRRSHRCNPINPKFMADISDAYESAYTIMLNLNKTWV